MSLASLKAVLNLTTKEFAKTKDQKLQLGDNEMYYLVFYAGQD